MLYKMLNECGKQLDMAYKGPDQYMEQDFTDYILSLKPYSLFLGVHLQPYYFEKFVSDVRLENSRNIIEKQWDNIICVAENSDKAFIDIFDDVFSKCIDQYDDVFFHTLSDSDVLCRVVPEWDWDESRFIPWDELFSFREELTEKEIGQFVNELSEVSLDSFIKAFEMGKNKIKEYPHCDSLI